ncbi:hypothetical protein LJC58_07740 [Lachnospiraceae bacterium OttesenSCG-928-D06]|nr:hypothetical protein [Lachnospiraceae bacterium OttesenSCG-928-D06]
MKEKIARFMQGRYGTDRLNQFLLIVSIICILLSFFGGEIFYVLFLGLMIYTYYRMFSKQIYKRGAENQWYLTKEMAVRRFFLSKKKEIGQRKTAHIYKCPNCKQKIRVPKGRGKIEIRCQKCETKFIKKS